MHALTLMSWVSWRWLEIEEAPLMRQFQGLP